MMVAFNLTGAGKIEDMVDPGLTPQPRRLHDQGLRGADKFVNSNLDAGLKEKGIKTVIVTGTSAQGAVGATTNGAAQRGYKAVVPIDATSRRTPSTSFTDLHIYRGGPATSPECDGDAERPDQVRGLRGAHGGSQAQSTCRSAGTLSETNLARRFFGR